MTAKAPSLRVSEIYPIGDGTSAVKLVFQHGVPLTMSAFYNRQPVPLENVNVWTLMGRGAEAEGNVTATFSTPTHGPGIMGFSSTGPYACYVECFYPTPDPKQLPGFLRAMRWLRGTLVGA